MFNKKEHFVNLVDLIVCMLPKLGVFGFLRMFKDEGSVWSTFNLKIWGNLAYHLKIIDFLLTITFWKIEIRIGIKK